MSKPYRCTCKKCDECGIRDPETPENKLLAEVFRPQPACAAGETGALIVWVRKTPLEIFPFEFDGNESLWISDGWEKKILSVIPFDLERENAALRAVAQAFLDDMIDRAKTLAEYNGKPVELPVGNGVLHDLKEALAGKAVAE